MASLRRFNDHKPVGRPLILDKNHPAIIEKRSLYTKTAGKSNSNVLVSGFNSRKIGKICTKGKWKGFPIYTLTLEERKTCPESCVNWHSCYGNKMHWSRRNQAGLALEDRLDIELAALQNKFPNGFIVRLHVLGDFYSVEYVNKWLGWLEKYPALHVFGYTARTRYDFIGISLEQGVRDYWDRFAIRTSDRNLLGPFTKVIRHEDEAGDATVCPAQTDKTACCATCGLCWNSKAPIAFLEH